MDATNASYVVGWVMSGEIEVKADTPEQAIRRAKAKMRSLTKNQGEMKVSTIKTEFAIPSRNS